MTAAAENMGLVDLGEWIRPLRAIFFDASGVLKNAYGLLPGVADRLRELTERQIPYWVITNDCSASPAHIAQKMRPASGPPVVEEHQIVCPGMLLTEELRIRHTGQRIAYLGGEASAFYLKAATCIPVPVTELDALADVGAFAVMDGNGFDWQIGLTQAVNVLRHGPAIPLYAPNPDQIYLREEDRINIAPGSLATLIEAIVGRPFLRLGKPDQAIFQYALLRAQRQIPDLQPQQVAMVGDSLTTDVTGARACGLRTLLVLSGITTAAAALNAPAHLRPDAVARSV